MLQPSQPGTLLKSLTRKITVYEIPLPRRWTSQFANGNFLLTINNQEYGMDSPTRLACTMRRATDTDRRTRWWWYLTQVNFAPLKYGLTTIFTLANQWGTGSRHSCFSSRCSQTSSPPQWDSTSPDLKTKHKASAETSSTSGGDSQELSRSFYRSSPWTGSGALQRLSRSEQGLWGHLHCGRCESSQSSGLKTTTPQSPETMCPQLSEVAHSSGLGRGDTLVKASPWVGPHLSGIW